MINPPNLVINAAASIELLEAFEYYKRISTGLGTRFRNGYDASVQKIINNPLAFRKIKENSGIRRLNFTGFPYKIYYSPFKENILIIAIIHSQRSSRFIKKRIKQKN